MLELAPPLPPDERADEEQEDWRLLPLLFIDELLNLWLALKPPPPPPPPPPAMPEELFLKLKDELIAAAESMADEYLLLPVELLLLGAVDCEAGPVDVVVDVILL